jgi:hypothetical protein
VPPAAPATRDSQTRSQTPNRTFRSHGVAVRIRRDLADGRDEKPERGGDARVVGVRAKPGAFMRSVTHAPHRPAVGALGGPAGAPLGPVNHGDHDRTEEQERFCF